MEELNEMPIDWELLLERQSPEDAMIMLKNELGPSILDIMEDIVNNLQKRRFLAIRQTVIGLIDYFNNYEAGPCIKNLLLIKEDLLQFDCFDENTLRSMIYGIQNLFLDMKYLLTYLQDALLIYPLEQEEIFINQKLKDLNSRLLKIQMIEQTQQFSPKNWKDSLIF